jgi:dienelactone hydrolase
MRKAGKSVDIKIYEGADHGFLNSVDFKQNYRPEFTEDAWARMINFLSKTLY